MNLDEKMALTIGKAMLDCGLIEDVTSGAFMMFSNTHWLVNGCFLYHTEKEGKKKKKKVQNSGKRRKIDKFATISIGI